VTLTLYLSEVMKRADTFTPPLSLRRMMRAHNEFLSFPIAQDDEPAIRAEEARWNKKPPQTEIPHIEEHLLLRLAPTSSFRLHCGASEPGTLELIA